MQDKKRLSINIVAQIISFSVQFAINFFLTPYIVEKLGAEAYGFIGLASSFVMYAQILTVALNSMAGRFIAIEYHKGRIENASRFYTSVFYGNLILSIILSFVTIICCSFLEYFINIPKDLIGDVKVLFLFLMLNFLVSILFSVFDVATFIKNRLDLVAVRSIFSNIIRVIVIVPLFAIFIPKLWYVGLASIICSIYMVYVNYKYKIQLTPELKVRRIYFEYRKILRIISSGIWNTVSRLANLLSQGLDLLFANLFIGATAMGYFSITKHFPVVIVSLVNSICSAFAPSLTKYYAKGEKKEIEKELLLSVKITGALSTFPLCFLFAFGDRFYKLWLPNQDSQTLYILTLIGICYLPINLALEGIQNIWPVFDKVKTYSLYSILFSILTLLTLFSAIYFVPVEWKIYFLAGVSAFWNLIKFGLFVPLYASKCLGLKKSFFYADIARVLFATILIIFCLLVIKKYSMISSWATLFLMLFLEVVICIGINYIFILKKEERMKISNYILNKIHS